MALSEPAGVQGLTKPEFDELYDQYFAFVWRNLRRLGVLEPNLWDAAQDVFVVIHRRLDDFEPRGSVRSWVYSIVARVARQHRRGMRRKQAQSVEDEAELVDERGLGPEQRAEQNQGLQRLMSLLDGLDADKREAFALAELEGLTAPEIAGILGVNINTIYARIRAARQQLEAALEQVRKGEG